MTTTVPPAAPVREDTERLLRGIWTLSRIIGQDIDPLLQADYGIDLRGYGLLRMIADSAYPKDLSQKLKLPSSLVSRHLDQLSGLGLIERHLDAHDSRRIRLELTGQGRTLIEAVAGRLHEALSARLEHLSPQALAQFLDTLESLTRSPEDRA